MTLCILRAYYAQSKFAATQEVTSSITPSFGGGLLKGMSTEGTAMQGQRTSGAFLMENLKISFKIPFYFGMSFSL